MKRSLIAVALISAIVGAILALTLRPVPRPHPPFEADGTNAILVGPKAKNLSIPTDHLDAAQGDVAVWVSANPKATLYIDFHEEIFDGMTKLPGGLYRVQCSGNRCDSGPIKSGVPHDPKGYKYDQTITDASGTDHEDGRIIIKP